MMHDYDMINMVTKIFVDLRRRRGWWSAVLEGSRICILWTLEAYLLPVSVSI
jgi:hypothetical protein